MHILGHEEKKKKMVYITSAEQSMINYSHLFTISICPLPQPHTQSLESCRHVLPAQQGLRLARVGASFRCKRALRLLPSPQTKRCHWCLFLLRGQRDRLRESTPWDRRDWFESRRRTWVYGVRVNNLKEIGTEENLSKNNENENASCHLL